MLRCVMPFELLSNPARLGGLESLAETGRSVNVQIAHDKDNGIGVRVHDIGQVAQDFSKVK